MINNLLYDYKKNDRITKIENGGIELANSFTKKINFYNPETDEPLHKFWFYIPNAKLIKKQKNKIQIVLSRNDIKLINSLCSLDDLVDSTINKLDNNIKTIYPTVIQSNSYPPILELIVDYNSLCYNSNNEQINFMSIYAGAKLKLYIELESVTIYSTKCTKKWRVIQIKKEKKIDLTVNLFDTPLPPPPLPISIRTSTTNKQISLPVKKVTNKTPVTPTSGTYYAPPTQNQLLDALNQLKNKKKKRINKNNIKPVVNQDNKTPVVNQDNKTPVVNQDNKTPVVNQNNIKPVVNQNNIKPVVIQDNIVKNERLITLNDIKRDILYYEKQIEDDNTRMINDKMNVINMMNKIDNIISKRKKKNITVKKTNSIFNSNSESSYYNRKKC